MQQVQPGTVFPITVRLKLRKRLCPAQGGSSAALMGLHLNSSLNSQKWGFEMKYKEIALLPNLAIKELALNTPGGRITVKQWKDVPFTVEDFNFEEYCKDNFPDLVD